MNEPTKPRTRKLSAFASAVESASVTAEITVEERGVTARDTNVTKRGDGTAGWRIRDRSGWVRPRCSAPALPTSARVKVL